jgi:hypothetical protein
MARKGAPVLSVSLTRTTSMFVGLSFFPQVAGSRAFRSRKAYAPPHVAARYAFCPFVGTTVT